MKSYKQKLLASLLLNLALFITFFSFFKPIYNTEEDVYILYMLSGSFGNPATFLLHYNYGIHPLVGMMIKNLFELTSAVNWYSMILIFFHYISCSIIFLQLISKTQKLVFILLYVLLFIVFESRQLLHINFTNTAIITGCAGLLALYGNPTKRSGSRLTTTIAFLLIVSASLFRIHVLIPLIGISLPFLLFKNFPKLSLQPVFILVVSACSIFMLNQIHRSWYSSAIPGWQKEEVYRQKIYKFYNNEHLHIPEQDQKWATEFNLIQSGLPLDTSFLTSEKLDAMFSDLEKTTTRIKPVTEDGKNWFLINNRVFLLTLLLVLLVCCRKKEIVIPAALSLLFTAAGIFYLSTYLKSPEYILTSCLFLISTFLLLSKKDSAPFDQKINYGIFAAIILLSVWGTIRLYKINLQNINGINRFKKSYMEISKRREMLFIITDSRFPLQNFFIFDLPGNFQLPNYLGSEHFLQNIYEPVFQRFNLKESKDIPMSKKVFLWGTENPALKKYFMETSGKKIVFSAPLYDFKEGEVRTVSLE